MLSGEVEADETFIGGKHGICTATFANGRSPGRAARTKAAVMGILERGGKVGTKVITNRKKGALQAEVRKHVQAGSALYTYD